MLSVPSPVPLFQKTADFTDALRKLIVAVFLFLLLVSSLLALYQELRRSDVSILPFRIPESMLLRGYTGEVLASKLGDRIGYVQTLSLSRKNAVGFSPSDAPDLPGFDLILPGASFSSVLGAMKRFFSIDRRTVSGEFVLTNETQGLFTIRMDGFPPKTVPFDAAHPEEALQAGAEYVFRMIDPTVLAGYLWERYDTRGAMSALRRSFNDGIPENDKWAYNLLGTIYLYKSRYDDALEAYAQAVWYDTGFSDAYGDILTILGKMGRLEEARRFYGNIFPGCPDPIPLYQGMANALASNGQEKEAAGYYRKIIEEDPAFADAYVELARLLQKQGKCREAEKTLLQGVEKLPELAYLHTELGGLLTKNRRLAEAERQFFTALEENERDAKALSGLADLYYLQKRMDEAEALYQKAVAVDPGDETIYLAWGEVMERLGKKEKALEMYKKAAAIEPANRLLVEKLGEENSDRRGGRPLAYSSI